MVVWYIFPRFGILCQEKNLATLSLGLARLGFFATVNHKTTPPDYSEPECGQTNFLDMSNFFIEI
jgi:hypothetical protein